jgi:hypothetical protein
MADVYMIDGQQLTPSSFAQTNAVTGVWEPKPYTGTYGNNGFHLEFKDTTVGRDTSGNNNHFAPTNISTTLGTTYDLMTDVPTQWSPRDGSANVRGNYATLNPLTFMGDSILTLSNGNLYSTGNVASVNGKYAAAVSTIGMSSGKWYFESTLVSFTAGHGADEWGFGLYDATKIGISGRNAWYYTTTYTLLGTGYKYNNNANQGLVTGYSFTTGDVMGVAFDADAGTLQVNKNGGSFTTLFSGIPAGTYLFGINNYDNTQVNSANFGQRGFAYTPPSGYKALCTTNLPTPTIGATVATAANKYFDATTYTGTGSSRSITGLNFAPDFVWFKSRSYAYGNGLFDTIRGVTRSLQSQDTAAEETRANDLTAFNSDGFTIGTGTNVNQTSNNYVAWSWNAGGANATNTSGTITSIVRANPTAGFSIVTYTGTGSNATVGHGLGVAPSMIVIKGRSVNSNWPVWHTVTSGNNLFLNSTDAASSTNYRFSGTPNSTTFGISSFNDVNTSAATYVAYCWAPIAGYSAFGSYTGNGSTDGPFIYTGFRPRWIMIKNAITSTTSSWSIVDTSRDTYNVTTKSIFPNKTNAEDNGTETGYENIDILSNGFKIRCDTQYVNNSGDTIIYAAFAENPFKNAIAR